MGVVSARVGARSARCLADSASTARVARVAAPCAGALGRPLARRDWCRIAVAGVGCAAPRAELSLWEPGPVLGVACARPYPVLARCHTDAHPALVRSACGPRTDRAPGAIAARCGLVAGALHPISPTGRSAPAPAVVWLRAQPQSGLFNDQAWTTEPPTPAPTAARHGPRRSHSAPLVSAEPQQSTTMAASRRDHTMMPCTAGVHHGGSMAGVGQA